MLETGLIEPERWRKPGSKTEPTTSTPPAGTLSDLDQAFAFAIYDASVRYWHALTYLISRCTSQPFSELEPRLRGALLGSAAQIIVLDRVPRHAVINHAVEWCKVIIRPGAGAMANAVLRKLADFKPETLEAAKRERYTDLLDELPSLDGSAIVLSTKVLPENELDRLAVATSHPSVLLQQWLRQVPMRDVRARALHGMIHPPVILNTAHALQPLPQGTLLTPHDAPGHHVFTGSGAELRGLLGSRSDIWVQDPASALAVQSALAIRPRPHVVLDLCAGHGTKTRQLARTFPNAEIIATDIDSVRFASLQRVFGPRDNSTPDAPANVRVLPMADVKAQFWGKADLILLDVPCSNTGVLARRPEARLRFSHESLGSVIGVQKQIIADSIGLIADTTGNPPRAGRGRILYSTCSLEPQENAAQAAWADKWHKLGISHQQQQLPQGTPGGEASSYCDGAFSAILG